MKKVLFEGCGTAISTPFDENGVNIEEFGRLLENQIENGVDSIIVCGTTGESSTMTKDERKQTIKFAIDVVNKRTKVIAGTGSNNTQDAIEMSKYAESVGADGLLIVTPYYNKTTQKGLIAHYTEIAKNVSIPIILYSVPSRTGVNILPEICLELSKVENIVAIKEASGNISQVAKIASLCGDNLSIYSGNDDQIIPLLSLGGEGVISVLANVLPKETHEMCHLYLNGNTKEALELQLKYLNLSNTLFIETNPIPVKTAMNLMGFECGELRLPLSDISKQNLEILRNNMIKYGIKVN